MIENQLLPDLRIAEVNAQPFRHGSLFSGIGGFDLAAQWMGWENVFHCEWNEFGKKVLNYYWPNAISYDDITKTDFTIHRGNIDILTGGFPCQPYSHAGKRLGKEDERHLWPEMLRAVREISPRWVVGENVSGITNWNGGLVFNEVQADLEVEGYEILPFLLPAASVGAPHKRERIWFIAYNTNTGIEGLQQRKDRIYKTEYSTDTERTRLQIAKSSEQFQPIFDAERNNSQNDVTDTNSHRIAEEHEFCTRRNLSESCVDESRIFTNTGCSERENGLHGKEQGRETTEFGDSYTKFGRFSKFPIAEPTVCRGNDGLSSQLDGITFSKWRNESIKAYGNAIVPQVVYQIFNAISVHEAEYGWR
ncbi:MAG: DNA (cytosine-5-)-methyltransferase [Candidatus Paceibacterota bacterium]|jgi:DNA (cytosine-5)-methyltransferase 1